MNGGTPLWGVQPTDLRRATTERRGCQDDCEYSTQYSISTAQLCLWDGCAQLMLCSGSCGTESQSWGMSSVLCSAPLTTATAPPRQNPQPAKCPCCPARLPKMQKDQAAPPTSPIPQNGPIPSNASGSVLSSCRSFLLSSFSSRPSSSPSFLLSSSSSRPIPRACHQHMQK